MLAKTFETSFYQAIKRELSALDVIGIAESLGTAGETELKSELYRAWIKYNSDNPLAFVVCFNYSALLSDLKDLVAAKHYSRESIRMNPKFFPAYIKLGNILERFGATKKAMQCWQDLAYNLQSTTDEEQQHQETALHAISRLQAREENIETTKIHITAAEIVQLVGKEDPVILDVGCNDGTHSNWFINMFQKGKVYSFEPDPRPIERYKNKVTSERAQLFEYAISDIDGVTDFYPSQGYHPKQASRDMIKRLITPDEWDQSGSIKKPKQMLKDLPWIKFDKTLPIQTKRLDTWSIETGIVLIDFIWADVQGAEDNLIKGAEATLKRTRFLFMEYSNHEEYLGQKNITDLLAMLPDFSIVKKYAGDVLLVNETLV